MMVFVEFKKGELVGRDGDLWLVDTGDAIVKSKYEPVTHKFPEGWYIKAGKPVLVKHYTAWVRDGALVPIYNYVDHSTPPFGSNCMHEHEVEKLATTECPYLPDGEIEQIADEHDEKIAPLYRAVRDAETALQEARKARRDALSKCQHKWGKRGEEEPTSHNGLGHGYVQAWECETCGTEFNQHYTKLG